MRLHVDHESDAAYLRLDESPIVDSLEIVPGVVVDYDERSHAVAIEVLSLSRRTTTIAPGTLIFKTTPAAPR